MTKNYGGWQIINASANITLGYFDETAFSLGRLRLLEGRLPEADDEVVLEKNAVLYKCKKGTGVGDRLPLASGGAEKEFTIVGVIADYTGYWDTFVNESVVAGYNDFPQALTTDQALGSNESNMSCLLYLKRYNIFENPIWNLVNSAEGGGQEYYDNYFDNSLLYMRVVEEKLGSFRKFQQAFRYAILGGACLTAFAALALYLNNYKRGYSLLYMLGASRRYAGGVFGVQCVLTVLAAIPAGGLLAFLFSLLTRALLGPGVEMRVFTPENYLWPAIVLALGACFMALRFRQVLLPLHETSLSELKESQTPPQMIVEKRFLPALTSHFLRSNFMKVAAVLLMLSVLVTALGIEQVYMGELKDWDSATINPDFEIESGDHGFTARTFQPFVVTNVGESVFSFEDVMKIRSMEGVRDTWEYLNIADLALVIPAKEDPYWGSFASRSPSFSFDEPTAAVIRGTPKDVIVLNGSWAFEVRVIEEDTLAWYRETYPDLPFDYMREHNAVALFLPPYGEEDSAPKNDLLQMGGQVTFGRLKIAEGALFSQVSTNPSLLSYEETSREIAYIANEGFRGRGSVSGRKDNVYQLSCPTVFMWSKTAEELSLGQFGVNIYLEDDISESAYTAIEEQIRETIAANPNSRVYSKREDQAQHNQLATVLNTSLLLLFSVFGGFTLLAVYTALSMALLRRKRSLVIYRAMGMRRRTLFAAILWELLFYWLFAILLAFAISMAVFAKAWGWIVLPEIGAPMMRVLVYSLLAGVPICLLIVGRLLRSVYSESVYSAIRFE